MGTVRAMIACASGVEVAAGGQVHDRVGAPALGPLELLDLFVGAEETGEAPMLALTLVLLARPMPSGRACASGA
jgi:hypothetical protein